RCSGTTGRVASPRRSGALASCPPRCSSSTWRTSGWIRRSARLREANQPTTTITMNHVQPDLPQYEVLALRFAHTEFNAKDAFLGRGDVHDGPQPLDFFIWVVRGDGRTIVMDMGFGDEACAHRPI